MKEYEALLDKMKIFEKTYDVMRIVDPSRYLLFLLILIISKK
ncbi:hypothetical protein [Lacrimispora indolis]|nr:hypothetical protein [[Clostridium] methoxybenzovorans]